MPTAGCFVACIATRYARGTSARSTSTTTAAMPTKLFRRRGIVTVGVREPPDAGGGGGANDWNAAEDTYDCRGGVSGARSMGIVARRCGEGAGAGSGVMIRGAGAP